MKKRDKGNTLQVPNIPDEHFEYLLEMKNRTGEPKATFVKRLIREHMERQKIVKFGPN